MGILKRIFGASPEPEVREHRPPQKRAFAAAKNTENLSGWTSATRSIDSDIKPALKPLRARAREQAQNNDYIKKYLSMNVANIIGHTGIRLKSKVRNADAEGTSDLAARKLIEESWRRWGKWGIPTVDGIMSWHDVEKLVVRTVPQDGGILIRHVDGFPNAWGYAIQIIDVDFINMNLDNIKTREGNIIRMGIEKTPVGRPVAIWLYTNNPGDDTFFVNTQGQRFVRVPMEELEYIFLGLNPMQTHGYPWVHSALISLKHMGLYREAEIIMARLGSQKNNYFLQDKDAPDKFNLWDEENEDGQKFDYMPEPGESQALPPGVTVEAVDPKHPNSSYKEFQVAILQGAASGLDVSYASWASDLTKVNFSSMRQGVLDERNIWRGFQRFYTERLHERVFARWLPMAIMTDLAGSMRLADLQRLSNVVWRPRGWDWVDPQKDMTANEKAIASALKSRQGISAERGEDWADILEELKEEEEAARMAGVNITPKSAVAAAPVVVENEEGEELNAG